MSSIFVKAASLAVGLALGLYATVLFTFRALRVVGFLAFGFLVYLPFTLARRRLFGARIRIERAKRPALAA